MGLFWFLGWIGGVRVFRSEFIFFVEFIVLFIDGLKLSLFLGWRWGRGDFGFSVYFRVGLVVFGDFRVRGY